MEFEESKLSSSSPLLSKVEKYKTVKTRMMKLRILRGRGSWLLRRKRLGEVEAR